MLSILSFFLNQSLKQAAELAREVDGHSRVHRALLIEKALSTLKAKYAFMPNVGMDVETLAAVEPEAHEALRSDVISR